MLFIRIYVEFWETILKGGNMRNKIIYSVLAILTISVMFLTGCTNQTTDNEDIKTKVGQELEYLDSQIISIANKLNNISMQNYVISSEEVNLGQENSSGTSSSQSGNEPSGGSGSSGGEQKESSSQSSAGQESEKTNITATQMEPNTILDSDENNIDWKSIKAQIETINEAWGVVILDLSNLNVDSNDILGFSSTLDNCILSIKDENKTGSLTNIAKLYSYIPKFESGISAEGNVQNVKQVKSNIINAYSLVEQNDWTAVTTNISEGESNFRNLLNDMEYIQNKEYKVNRTYVLIKELQNSLSYQDKKLFYVKYKNLMESVNDL